MTLTARRKITGEARDRLQEAADAARRFLGAKTVDQQLAERNQQLAERTEEVEHLRADLADMREMLGRVTTDLARVLQRNEALQWSLVMAHTQAQSIHNHRKTSGGSVLVGGA